MKKAIFSLLLLFVAIAMSAQTLVKGDMNDDGQVTVADVTSLVNVAVGRTPMTTINVGGSPFAVDNSYVAGTWYASDGTHFTLNADGTTDYGTGFTYKFRPYQGTLMMFNASGKPVKTFVLNEVDSAYLLAVNYATGDYTYYTNQASLVTGLTMSQSRLSMNSGTTQQLTVTTTPADAFNATLTWTSSDENVATVDQNGLVTAVAGGTATVTATTIDGGYKTAQCTVTVTQMVTSITLSQTAVVLELDEFVRLTATVLPENAANKSVVWSSSNPDIAPVRNGRVDAYDYGTVVITCTAADGSGVKATCVIGIVEENIWGTLVDHSYVDLGLPSGTLWATCNIGAENPEDYGDYFSWGETEPYDENGKTNFEWSTYRYCNGKNTTLTKYCNNSSYGYNGFTDNLIELLPEDDAAYINWGPAWRMPSKEQFEELINSSYTTTTWTTQNGVNGRLITSKTNGNSIFLPAAGYRIYMGLSAAGGICSYSSRTLVTGNPSCAWLLNSDSGGVRLYGTGYGRFDGESVRPVLNIKE